MFPSSFHRGLTMHHESEGPDTSHAEVDAAPDRVCERVPAARPTRSGAEASMVSFKAFGSRTPLAKMACLFMDRWAVCDHRGTGSAGSISAGGSVLVLGRMSSGESAGSCGAPGGSVVNGRAAIRCAGLTTSRVNSLGSRCRRPVKTFTSWSVGGLGDKSTPSNRFRSNGRMSSRLSHCWKNMCPISVHQTSLHGFTNQCDPLRHHDLARRCGHL